MLSEKTVLKNRIKLVRAMDEIAHTINDEDIFRLWRRYGVPYGEIEPNTRDKDLEWLVKNDEQWQKLLGLFSRLMFLAYKNGGIWA